VSTQVDSGLHWNVRYLEREGVEAALTFLRREPLINIYLISRLLEEGLDTPHARFFEIRFDGSTACIALVGPNVTVATAPDISPGILRDSMAFLAEIVITRMIPVRAIIASVNPVDILWQHLRGKIDPPTVSRLHQPVYVIDPSHHDFPDLEFMRPSIVSDLPLLVPACAAMHLEEVGINPVDRDAVGYRRRIEDLVRKNRSFVGLIDGRIAFKCEISAETEDAVQLMGVWTAPELRRKGLARKGMREICGHIAQSGRVVTLFVNDFNKGALDLYENLGFKRIGVNRALIW